MRERARRDILSAEVRSPQKTKRTLTWAKQNSPQKRELSEYINMKFTFCLPASAELMKRQAQ